MLSNIVRTSGHWPVVHTKSLAAASYTRCRHHVLCKNKIGDELLDFVTAGPKLRKWYGASERPVDGGEEQEPEEPGVPSDVVLVTEADSPIGEQVVLQLILARQQLRLVVRDVAAAKTAYGPYATPLPSDAVVSPRTMRGVKCLMLMGRPPRGLLAAALAAKVRHIILLAAAPSASSSSGGFLLGGFSLGGGSASRELRNLADTTVEAEVKAAGLPYSIVKVSGIVDAGRVGGGGGVALAAAATADSGSSNSSSGVNAVSREALGALLSGLVDAVPERGRTLQASGSGDSALSPSFSSRLQQEALAAALQVLKEDV